MPPPVAVQGPAGLQPRSGEGRRQECALGSQDASLPLSSHAGGDKTPRHGDPVCNGLVGRGYRD